jgi:hypothetical protein
MFSSLVRRLAPAGIVILFLMLGLPRELSSAASGGQYVTGVERPGASSADGL